MSAAIQLGIYATLLRSALTSGDMRRARPALMRWILIDVVWQGVVIAAAWAYLALTLRARPGGVAWIAPSLAAIFGTALPLQVVIVSVLRAARR